MPTQDMNISESIMLIEDIHQYISLLRTKLEIVMASPIVNTSSNISFNTSNIAESNSPLVSKLQYLKESIQNLTESIKL